MIWLLNFSGFMSNIGGGALPSRKELLRNAMSYENGNTILLCYKSFGGGFFEAQNVLVKQNCNSDVAFLSNF
ncbi:MAG: hypothetical protein ACI4U1_05495, partial [Anaerovoracaceae bacterium]